MFIRRILLSIVLFLVPLMTFSLGTVYYSHKPDSKANPDSLSKATTQKSALKSQKKTSETAQTKKTDSKEYYKGREIKTGPRGGKYYINSKGNKVYIKRNKS